MTNRKSLTVLLLVSGALLVLILISALCLASYRHRRSTRLYDEGLKAFQQGHYDEAYLSLKNYLATDPNHEDAWKMFAEIEESRDHWLQAAVAWQRLTRLNVLEDEYVRKYVQASYRCHDYQTLFDFFRQCDPKWRGEFQEIHALSAFKAAPEDAKTAPLVDALPSDSGIARLIRALKNRGPAEEIAKLEEVEDPVLRVEAFLLDGFLAEFIDKDMERAEKCFGKAAEINPFLCQSEYGDFLFRCRRYKESFEAYSCKDGVLLSLPSFLNYAETAYAMGNGDALEKIGESLHNTYPSRIQELAYIHALKAHLDGDGERMKSNHRVANQKRRTPMAMRLNFAVATANGDLQLMAQSVKYLATSQSFAEKRQQILQQITPVLQANAFGKNLNAAAEIAELFLDLEPANGLVWKIVILGNWRQKTLTPETLNKAIELFPSEPLFRQLALLETHGDASAISQAFDQWIAVSQDPSIVQFRKANFLQQNGKEKEAEAEIVKMTEGDSSLLASKISLVYGLRNGNRAAIEQAGKRDELKPIVSFEIERLFGDKDKAIQMLHDTRIEETFTAKADEDRPILLSLAIYLAIIHEVDRSIAVYEQLKPYATSDATIELNLSELYSSKGEKAPAIENAKSALTRFPNSPLVRSIYGLRCAESADFKEAIAYIPDDVQDARLHDALVFSIEKLIAANFESGHLTIVREQLEHLRKVRPESPVIEEYTKKIAEREAESGK